MRAKRAAGTPRRDSITARERAAVEYAAWRQASIILFDTNIVLDVLLKRHPWSADSARLLALAASGDVTGVIASHAITTIYYVVTRERDRVAALAGVRDLLSFLTVVELSGHDKCRGVWPQTRRCRSLPHFGLEPTIWLRETRRTSRAHPYK